MASTGLAMIAVTAASVAQAQQAPAPSGDTSVTEVIVVGSRASQQSSINRKKKAKTATDSIVADDVGSFPDRNLNEAISRIPGMALTRGETGEGETMALRGNGADLTRVEMDGMSVASSGFDLAMNQSGGRASDLRELPADLIKSVDVVKGQTPDMTQGGLGGTVQVQTRSGLDFKKPYLSLRVAGERNSISRKWSPDINIVASRKFFDNRLGVIFNLSSRRFLGDSHQMANAGGNNWGGYLRAIDLDNSAEKTFQYDPSLVTGDGANTPISTWDLVAGGKFSTDTPIQVVTKAAAAKSKADCDAAFPLYSEATLNSIVAGGSNNNRRDLQAQRIRERISCLNQWNDYTPQIVRETWLNQYEDRLTWDLRFDYRVNSNLTVFAKYQETSRHQLDSRSNRTQGGITLLTGATTGVNTLPQISNPTVSYPVNTPMVMTVLPNTGYYLYNPGYTTGLVQYDNTAGSTTTNNSFPVIGQAVNIVPGSIVMDGNHHLLSAEITNSVYNVDHIRNDQNWDTSYLQVGADYNKGPLKVEFRANRSETSYTRYDKRVAFNLPYGSTKMYAQSNGTWAFQFPAGVDLNNPANYVTLNPAAATAALYTSNIQLGYGPRLVESTQDEAKLDATYRLPEGLPFFTSFKTGIQYRKAGTQAWNGDGYIPKPGVYVPTLNLRSQLRACQNQATTTAANACVYGYVPNASTTVNFNHGVQTVTVAQLTEIIGSSVLPNTGQFLPDIEGAESMRLWNSIDLDKFYAQVEAAKNYNFNCLKSCTASDGNVYPMISRLSGEQFTAAYYMVEFEQELPFGMEFGGNFGVRAVESKVAGTGFVSVNSIRKNFTDDGNPNNDWNANEGNTRVTTTTIVKPVAIEREYRYWLPSYNAYLWAVPDKLVLRYSWTKAVAPPPLSAIFPAGSCTVDERIEDRFDDGETDLMQGCSGFGNPDLKPYAANRNNTSVEWYVNKDTMISLAYYRQKVKVGAPVSQTLLNYPLFEGSEEIDPATGRKLSDFKFSYGTTINGPGYVQAGWEFATKTALSFLPWRFRYTGFDFNYSTNKSVGGQGGFIDPLTGMNLGTANRPDYTANLSLWYDDGKTNARISYQKKAEVLECVSSCTRNDNTVYSFPNANPLKVVGLPYNPGEGFYQAENAYLDAKITHKLTPNIELYWEGRNLMRETARRIGTKDRGFSDLPETPWTFQYGGRRFTVGMIYKMQ
ncbi:TonB-dependent receptor [Asticcacaulis sp. BYS171W]|uniref:TonB-dependent receptor n=1 Tax=Asticcacaulis aquaticus TaxID=2984212 RepID=A0ABT5HXK4_9CAUL|nr:TonB-dependent receptor [Asticcacaulis aquaticus]MDC7684186.1 TonB-dependent receptor [Asticcacaulis aquaticus]